MIKKIFNLLPKRISDRIEQSPIGNRLATGAAWSLVGSLTAKFLQLVSFVVVARIFGKEGFGEFSIVQSTVAMFGTLAGFGLGLASNKFISEFKLTNTERAGRIISLTSTVAIITSTLAAVLLFATSSVIAQMMLNAPQLQSAIALSSILLFFIALTGSQTGILTGFEAFKEIARINFINGISSFPILIVGVYFGGLTGAIIGLIIITLINWIQNYIAIRRQCIEFNIPLKSKGFWEEKKTLFQFSIPSVLGSILIGAATWFTSTLLVNQNNGYAEMGIYSAILRVKQIPELIIGMFLTPLLPVLSEQYGLRNKQTFNKTLKYGFALSILLGIPFAGVLLAFPNLTYLPFGSGFKGSAITVQILMLHLILVATFTPMGQTLASMNKMWFGFFYNVAYGLFFVVMSYMYIPEYGATGLAIAQCVSYFITSMICIVYIYITEKEFIIDTGIIRSLFTILIFTAIIFVLSFMLPAIWLSLAIIVCAVFITIKHLPKIKN